MGARRLTFWLAVAGVSVASQYALEAAANRWEPIARFTAFAHRGATS